MEENDCQDSARPETDQLLKQVENQVEKKHDGKDDQSRFPPRPEN